MSKKSPTPPRRPSTPTTAEAASRVQSAIAKENGGKVQAGSYVGRLQRASIKTK